MAKAPWTTLKSNPGGKSGNFICERCGGKQPYKLEMAASAFVDMCRAFADKHKACKKPRKAKP